MYTVDTLEKWHRYELKLRNIGYKLWQMQYSWDNMQGFHAWFGKPGEDDIGIVTHSKDVQEEIIRFETK